MKPLLTTYLSKLNKIPEDYTKLIITRFPPKWLDINKYNDMYIVKLLSPNQDMLLNYKKDNNWEKYVSDFKVQMNGSEFRRILFNIEKAIKNKEKKVCLVCYEKDYTHCHRYLIAKELESRGIEWEEMK